MANEIQFSHALNKTLWAAVFKNDSGTYKVNVTGSDAWEAWNDANVATYDISLSEGAGGGTYSGTFPVSGTIAAGVYHVTIYEGSVAATDTPVGSGELCWDGTAEITRSALDTLIDTVKAETALIVADTDVIDDATSGLVKIASDVAAVLVDTNTTIPAMITTAQNDLDKITGTNGVLIDTDAVDADALKTDAVTEIKDAIAGADSDTLETLSDQIDGISTGAGQPGIGD